MPGARVTDPELLKILDAPEPPGAFDPAKRVTDPDLLRQLDGGEVAASAQPTDGRSNGAANAFARGMVNGLPIVGPYALAGIDKADAAVRSVTGDTRYSDEAAKAESYGKRMASEHPWANTAGEIAGGVVGTAPLVVAAPAAFGAGAGGLGVRTAASTLSGMGIGGADAAVRSGGNMDETSTGALTGAAFGVVAPGAGSLIGAGARKVGEAIGAARANVPSMSGAAAGKLVEDVRNAGGADAIRSRMTELGPESMLLDASPSLEGRAQGLAVLPDTREAIVDPLTRRAQGANARLGADVNQHLGPAMDPEAFRAAFREAYEQTVPPLYRDALGQPVTVDTSGVLETIGQIGATEKGGAHRALQRAWELMHAETDVPGVGRAMTPDRRPQALHNVKEELDAMIATVEAQPGGSARNSELRALTAVRRGVNETLEAQVPGYAEANRTAQHMFQQRDAFENGQTLLNGGREAARPAQVAADTAAMTPEVAQAQRLGLRAEVDRLVGTKINDRVALQNAIQGEGDFNRARMGTVFGEEPTAGVVGAVERERAFDATNNRVVNNSMTELRKRAADDVAPREIKPGSADAIPGVAGAIGGTQAGLTALGLKAGIKAGKTALNAEGRARDISRNRELAQAVTRRQDDELNRLLDAIAQRIAAEQSAVGIGRGAGIGANALVRSQSERTRPYVPFGFSTLAR